MPQESGSDTMLRYVFKSKNENKIGIVVEAKERKETENLRVVRC